MLKLDENSKAICVPVGPKIAFVSLVKDQLELIFFKGGGFMYRLVIFISLMLLSGCSGLANPFSAAAYVASEYVYDKPPIQFIADFFGKNCENYALYEEPARCRSH